jgi:hypothetical protein
MIAFASLAAAAALGVLAHRYGAESRPGLDEKPVPHHLRPYTWI